MTTFADGAIKRTFDMGGTGMKRDPDLIRRITFAIEGLQNGQYLSLIDGVEEHSFVAHVG
jgi:hypothetical protein